MAKTALEKWSLEISDAKQSRLVALRAAEDVMVDEISSYAEQLEADTERLRKLDKHGVLQLCDYIDKHLVPSPWRDCGIRLQKIGRQLRKLAQVPSEASASHDTQGA